jgi:hypothetical protein
MFFSQVPLLLLDFVALLFLLRDGGLHAQTRLIITPEYILPCCPAPSSPPSCRHYPVGMDRQHALYDVMLYMLHYVIPFPLYYVVMSVQVGLLVWTGCATLSQAGLPRNHKGFITIPRFLKSGADCFYIMDESIAVSLTPIRVYGSVHKGF